MVRRFATLALSLSLLLGLSGAHLFAQDKKDDAKKDEPKADAPKKDEAKKDEPKKDEPKKEEAAKKEESAAPKPIPPEVEAKLEAARLAVAEAIVAAQDAGLVNTSLDQPPILDILITGRATDEATLKDRKGVSPEVFGAWFTGHGKTANVNPQTDVRIIQPSAGLKAWYDQRDAMLAAKIEQVRKRNGTAKPAEAPKAEAPKAEAPKAEAPKAEAPKAEAKKEEAKKEEAKKEEPKKEEKKDEPKKEEKK